jgi:hypothetical protein
MNQLQAIKNKLFPSVDNTVECFLEHFFSDKIYVRQITMPGGAFVKGERHKTSHLNCVARGRVIIYDMKLGKLIAIDATERPVIFESMAGVSKTLYIHEETVWQTIHENPYDCRNVPELEELLVDPLTEAEREMPELAGFSHLLQQEGQKCLS